MKLINFISIVMLLVLVGCSGGGVDFYDPYYGGEGLYMNFLTNAPPDFVYEMQEFPIGLFLQNNGAHIIDEGIVTFSYEKDYIEKIWGDDPSIYLEGRTSSRDQGEEETKMFYFKAKKLDSLSQIHDSQIIANMCYNYLTNLKATVCIDPDIFDLTEGQKPCSVEDQSFSGQGGPVGITYIEETISLKQETPESVYPTFKISIENLDQGEVINQFSTNQYCVGGNIDSDAFKIVDINAWIGNEKLVCFPESVKLNIDGNGMTICKSVNGIKATGSAYTTLLSMELKYGYSFSKSIEFTILKTLR